MNCPITNFEDALTLVGDPINVITGANVDRALDLQVPDMAPFQWVRHYDSAQCRSHYALGWGQTHGYDRWLIMDTDGLRYGGPLGMTIGFPALTEDGQRFTQASVTLHRVNAGLYRIYQTDMPTMEFDYRDQLAIPISREVQGKKSIAFYYDQNRRLHAIRNSSRTILFRYDSFGHITELLLDSNRTQASRSLLKYSYDTAGNLVWAKDPYGNEFSFGFDNLNRITKRTDRRGFSFFFEYDGQGRCVRSVGQDGLHDTRLEYLLQEEVTLVTKADGGVWTYLHPGGKVIRIIDPHGGSREFVRDLSGKVLKEIDENQNVSKIVYGNGASRLGKVSSIGAFTKDGDGPPPANAPHAMPNCPLQWEWGNLPGIRKIAQPGREESALNDLGVAVNLARTAEPLQMPKQVFNEFGLLIQESHLRGAPRRWVYDVNGNTQRFHDHDGALFKFEYTSWDLRKSKIDPLGHSTSYEYNLVGLPSAIIDAGATRSEYAYNLKGELQEVRRHGVIRERYRYDMGGNLVEKLDGDNQPLLSIEIGPHNLKTTRKLASGDVHEFTYTDDGRLATAATNDHLTEFAYNAFSHRTKDMRDGVGVEHIFRTRGKLQKTVILGKFDVTYDVLPSGTLRIIDSAGNRHLVRKIESGLIQRTHSNRTSELAQYDPEGRCLLKVLFIKGSQSALWTRRYKYSGEGDLLSVEDNRFGTTTYVYDAAHRLANAESRRANGTREAFFRFDSGGNLLQKPGLSAVTLQEGNRLASANGDRFEYNNRNHIASRTSPSGVTRYLYDSRDMLIRCELSESSWSATYDPLGRRISKTFGESKTEFFWDSDRLIAEIYPSGRLRLYVYADHFALTPLLFLDYTSIDSDPKSAETFFLFTDHLSSPIRVEDVRGDVVWQAEYDPYGTAHIDPRSRIELNLRFPGHYFDQELNLHYNRFRYYSPELGRYLQSDPIGVAGGLNLYAYAQNPLSTVDLRGTCSGGASTGNGTAQTSEDGGEGEDTEPPDATGQSKPPGWLSDEELQDAADQIHMALEDARAERSRTTCVTQGIDEDGNVVHTVTSSTNLTDDQKLQASDTLGPNVVIDETPSPGSQPDHSNHAEQRGIAATDGQTDRVQASSSGAGHGGAACAECTQAQQDAGVRNATGVQQKAGGLGRTNGQYPTIQK